MTVFLALLAIVMVVAGLAGIVFPLLPGLPLMFAGFWLAAWADGYQHIGATSLVILGLLAAIGILCDFLAGALGARRVGASRRAVIGALIGSVIGIFFGLPGLIAGPFIGAVIGEIATRRGFGRAAEVGIATWIGLVVGTLAKLALSLAMLGVFAFAWFV